MKAACALTTVALLCAAGPASAVGFGPLTAEGLVDGPKKAFYLTLLNPYAEATDFVAYATGLKDEDGDAAASARVTLYPKAARLGSGRQQRILVVVGDLAVGEPYSFRVCAQRRTPPQGIRINARVCSKLTARRVA